MLRDVSARRLDQLDGLPPDVGERIRGLQDYDFMEPDARERFDELVKKLQGQVLDQFVSGMSEAIQSMTPGGPRRQPRDGPRPQRADPRADRRRRAGRLRVPGQARPVLPGRPDLRRHHRPARAADGRDAVADALDEPAAARRAQLDDGGAPARRPAPGRPRPARLEPRPAAAGRPRRSRPVRRR